MKRLIALLGTALVAACLLVGCSLSGSTPMTVTVMLPDSAGLFVGNDVGVLGVPVGKITALSPDGDSVRASLEITDPSIKLPANVDAAVIARSVAADRYVELSPAYTGGATLPDGAVIPRNRTVTPVDFDQVLASLTKVSSDLAGDPKAMHNLQQLLDVSTSTLSGHGGDLHSALASMSAAITNVSDNRNNIVGTLQSMENLTHALAANESTVRSFIDNSAQAAQLLSDERFKIGGALTSLSNSIDELGAFAAEHQTELHQDITSLTKVLQSTAASKTDLNAALDTLPLAGQNLIRAVSDGRVRGQQYPETLLPVGGVVAQLCNALPGKCYWLSVSTNPFDLLQVLVGVK